MSLRRTLTVGIATVAALLAAASPASAHTKVLLDSSDRIPVLAPLAVDGTDPFGFFAVLTGNVADVRSFQFNMQAGQTVHVNLGIPDKAPENTLSTDHLPYAFLIAPNCSVTTLTPNVRVPLTDENSGLLFIILNRYTAPALAGTYSVVMTGNTAARVVSAIGVESEEFHGLLRGTVATDEQIQHWFNTAP
jgi:hypothetical protein